MMYYQKNAFGSTVLEHTKGVRVADISAKIIPIVLAPDKIKGYADCKKL